MKFYTLILLVFFISLQSHAQSYRLNQKELPLYEIGMGLGWARLPYYPGSSTRRNFVVPFPSFVYRGKFLRSDEDGGLRGRLLNHPKLKISFSFGFNLPVSEENVPLRKGIGDLDTLFEIGPNLIYHIIPRSKESKFSLSASVSLRHAFSTDFKYTKQRGFTLNPRIYSWYKATKSVAILNSLSASFSTQEHQNFFYGVATTTPSLNSYDARSGLMSIGYGLFTIWNYKKNWSFVAGVKYNNFKAAANNLSPLHEKDSTLTTILGFNYWFFKSKTLTKVR